MALESLRIYQDATAIATEVTDIVKKWSQFDKRVLGEQLCRSINSIGSNISEGYGRSAPGERLQFLFNADGSLQEAKHQLDLAGQQSLVCEEQRDDLRYRLRRLSISIIEFCAAVLDQNPSYNGQYRDHVARRRAWLLRFYEERNSAEKRTNADATSGDE